MTTGKTERMLWNRIVPWAAAWIGCGTAAMSLTGTPGNYALMSSAVFFAYCLYAVYRMKKAVKAFFKEMDGEDSPSNT